MILLAAGDENPRSPKWGHWSAARWTVPTEGHRSEEGEGSKRASTMRACACGGQIRVSATEYERGYIMCGLCGKPFLTPGESDEPADRVIWLARAAANRAA